MKTLQERLKDFKHWKTMGYDRRGPCRPVYNPEPLEIRGGNAPFQIGATWCKWIEEDTLRFVGYCDAIASCIRHTGWWMDSFEDERARGIVFRLPSRSPITEWGWCDSDEGLFIAAIADPYQWNEKQNTGPFIMELHVYDSKRDAALCADHIARVYAEDSREAEEKFQEEQRLEQEKEDALAAQELELALCWP